MSSFFRLFKGPKRTPFPARWRQILQETVPLPQLSEEHRDRWEGLVRRFLKEKHFEGCGGFRVTERVRVTVAGQACQLLLGRDMDLLPGLRTILVYPSGFRVRETRHVLPGIVAEGEEERLGEAARDVVVLSWDDADDGEEGSNLIHHEIAHQVDFHFGLTDHLLDRTADDLTPWQRAFRREYKTFRRDRPRALDPYAAENPAEFFAVATETFFDAPHRLAAALPRLYALLQTVYQTPTGR